MKRRIASWLGYGYSAQDLRSADYRGFDRAVGTLVDAASREVSNLLFRAGSQARKVFEDDTIEFRVPREAFAVIKSNLTAKYASPSDTPQQTKKQVERK